MKRTIYAIGMVLVLALGVGIEAAQNNTANAKTLYQQALHQEDAAGDLKGAIALYERVLAAKPDRVLAAQALMRMGGCYQKLGDSESRKIYERILKDYSDQKEAVEMARAQLGKEPGSGDTRISFRQIWNLPPGGDDGLGGLPSVDGRYLPYIKWGQHGDLFVHDFSSNTNRRLTDTATDGLPGPKVDQFAEEASLSRDGRRVAYSWFRENRYELRLIDLVRGDGIPQSRLLLDNVEFAVPGDWSPDGKFVSVAIGRNDKTSQIGLVSVADGALRVLKSVDWRGPTMLVFSPDGKYLAYDIPANDSSDQRDILVLAVDGSREIPVIVGPSQDTVVGWSNDGKRLLFASDRSGSEALWSVSFADGRVQGTPELLRRDIGQFSRLAFMGGKLYGIVDRPNAGGSKGGDIHTATVDFRSEKLESPPSLAVQTYVGNNTFPAWSPDGKYLAYASRRGFVGLPHFVIAVRSLETGDVREISPSPGLKLLYSLAWTPDGHSLFAVGGDTKGRYGIFRIDAQTGQTTILHTKEAGDAIPADQGISADGKKLYFGKPYSVDGARTGEVGLIEKDLASGSERELLKTPNRAGRLSPDGKYLAIRGLDPSKPRAMFILPVAGGQPRELASDAGGTPEWAADGSAVYTIKAPGELWRLPIDGAEPRKVDLKWAPGIVDFQVHPDGRRIAFQTRFVSGPAEIWVLENFLPASSAKNQ